ncbi:LysR substrate-binding domain-containing protein [Paraburkholderia susongensis]|uniref:Transcriptional regulator, LysR family n=1 Tax=Paraburkholderia susongensis TaxID=1515439 RepID=A0A1X7LLE6_9BURK|nr:LysR substrate-binding domain-containing protein [Paraburkholderia susongensis]SMG53979.1 transcriptional regulator, LysR family [Paraburkholderia susongensis]
MPIKLHQLRALVAVADHGTIVGASRALFVSQPAVTKAIRELESDIGLTLFGRSVNGVALTQAGESLLRHARLIVGELGRAEQQMAMERGAQEGRVTVGVTPLAALTLLPDAYAQFRRDMPHITVEFLEFNLTKLQDQLRQGSLDFALAAGVEASTDPSIECSELMTSPLAFAVRANGELAKAKSLADLCDAEWLHSDTTDEYPQFVTELFTQQDLPVPRRITRCTSQSLLYSLAISIDVVMGWASHTLELANAIGHLKRLDFIETSRAARLHLMQRESAILTRPASYFIRCIRSAALVA